MGGVECGELALATVLLVGATLLIRSLIQLQHVPLGFDPEGVISLQVSLPPTKYPMPKRVTFFRDLREALQTIPVCSVSVSRVVFRSVPAITRPLLFLRQGDRSWRQASRSQSIGGRSVRDISRR